MSSHLEPGSFCPITEYDAKRENRLSIAELKVGELITVMCRLDDAPDAAKLPARLIRNELPGRPEIEVTMLNGAELSDGGTWTLGVTQTDLIAVKGVLRVVHDVSTYETKEAYGLGYFDDMFAPLLTTANAKELIH